MHLPGHRGTRALQQPLIPAMRSILERRSGAVLGAILALGAAASLAMLALAYASNGSLGFPLDDPWIHLQFARNLSEFGTFSYFGREMATSGSTSPLYTFLLGGGFLVGAHELASSYALGIAGLLWAAASARRIALDLQQPPWLALGAALLLVLEPRLVWASVSGMETTLFVGLLLATYHLYLRRQTWAAATAAGLLLWTRPEALLFYAAVGVDAAYHAWVVPARGAGAADRPLREWLPSLSIAIGLGALYAFFNVALSGSLLPNTYAAKIGYYAGTGSGFATAALQFFAGGSMAVVAPFALTGAFAIVLGVWKRRPQPLLVALLFPLGLTAAYALRLPYLYQEGRYLMPALPFVLLLATHGLAWLSTLPTSRNAFLRGRAIVAQCAFVVMAAALFAVASYDKAGVYAAQCRYIDERQVRAANWIRANTPSDAIVATHDIGAIGFYSGRRIVDMVGLVSPEMITRLGDLGALLAYLEGSGVTHVAVLRSWFAITNQRPLVAIAGSKAGEVLELYEFDPQRTHFTPLAANQALGAANQALWRQDTDRARSLIDSALRLDPRNSEAHYLNGALFLMFDRFEDAGAAFAAALRLDPELTEARIGAAQVQAGLGRVDQAIAQLLSIAEKQPELAVVYRVLAEIHTAHGLDDERAAAYLARAEALEGR